MKSTILTLIKKASTTIPKDVEAAIKEAYQREAEGSNAKLTLGDILTNVKIAREEAIPICQDTGTVIFYVTHPPSITQKYITTEIISAVKLAVRRGYLRPNAVDSITGKNSGSGVGIGNPYIHFTQSSSKKVRIDLMLKGGGSENVSTQYSLPDTNLKAYRDLNGVKRCVIDAVFKAQGQGCPPGIIGVGIGGDRASSYLIAKEQLFRKLTDTNPVAKLQEMEEELYVKLNELGIGPMGIGGKTTVLSVKIGAMSRVPASFFVSVAYMCWALRRASVTVSP